MKVYVVVSLEAGWDNIVGVFNSNNITKDELEEKFPRKYK